MFCKFDYHLPLLVIVGLINTRARAVHRRNFFLIALSDRPIVRSSDRPILAGRRSIRSGRALCPSVRSDLVASDCSTLDPAGATDRADNPPQSWLVPLVFKFDAGSARGVRIAIGDGFGRDITWLVVRKWAQLTFKGPLSHLFHFE